MKVAATNQYRDALHQVYYFLARPLEMLSITVHRRPLGKIFVLKQESVAVSRQAQARVGVLDQSDGLCGLTSLGLS